MSPSIPLVLFSPIPNKGKVHSGGVSVKSSMKCALLIRGEVNCVARIEC